MSVPISYEVFRAIVWAVGLPIILFLLWKAIRRVRALRELDARLREEEAATPRNPYADMAKMYEVQQIMDENRLFGHKQSKPANPNPEQTEGR